MRRAALLGFPLSLLIVYACTGEDPSVVVAGGNPDGSTAESGAGARLLVSLDPAATTLAPLETTSIKVRIVRPLGEDGTAVVTVEDADITAAKVEIAAAGDTADLALTANATAKSGSHVAKVKVDYRGASYTADLAVTIATTPGAFDLSFGDGGIVYLGSQSPDGGSAGIHAIALASDGIVTAGDRTNPDGSMGFDITKLTSTGALVDGFGVAGRVSSNAGSMLGVAVESGSDVILGGGYLAFSGPEAKAVHSALQKSGDGIFPGLTSETVQSTPSLAWSAAASGGGRYVGGYVEGAMKVWKVDANGTFVGAFSGQTTLPGDTGVLVPAIAVDMMVDRDGVIVLGDLSLLGGPAGASHVYLTRFDGSGNLDETFGTAGAFFQAFGTGLVTRAFARQQDSFIVIGYRQKDLAVYRISGNGHDLDKTFGEEGELLFDIEGGAEDRANDVAVDASGRIYIVGSRTGVEQEGVVLRLTKDGQRDPSFGTKGVVKPFPGQTGTIESLALQGDGMIVIGGTLTKPDARSFVARLRSE